MTYGKHLNVAAIPQTEPLPNRPEMVQNAAGGYVFQIDDMERVKRFLILGNEGGTDCALPLAWARQNSINADAIMVYTDNETWAGPVHAQAELMRYRKESGIHTKLGMVAFTATGASVADPTDDGSMNFVGLDASLPQAIAAFVG